MRASAKSLLLASAAAAALTVPALADSYFFRSKPLVDPPQSFSFSARSDQNPGTMVESSATHIKGHRGKTATISGGEYQVCATADCSGATWTSAPTANVPTAFHARVRVTAATFGQKAVARLAIGEASATFEVETRAKDTEPDSLTFTPMGNVEPNVAARSSSVEVKGHDGVALSVSGGGYQICATVGCSEMDDAPVATGSSAEVVSGTRVRLVATPTGYGLPATVTLTAGSTVGTFTATARAKDETPDEIDFAPASAAVGSEVRSEIRQLTNHEGVSVSVSGAQTQFRICSDATCSTNPSFGVATAQASRNSYVQLLRQAAPAAGTTAESALAYGTRRATWSVTGAAPVAKAVFTTCGATGYQGPTLAQCQTAYGASGPAISMTTRGKQEWTVPATGNYRLKVAGAAGGGTPGYTGGMGLVQTVHVSLAAGTKLTIVAGQMGLNSTGSDGWAGGGGGASLVSSPSGPLVVSGGGGGGGYVYSNDKSYPSSAFVGGNAQEGEAGAWDYTRRNSPGSGGQAGGQCYGGGQTGGAGWASAAPDGGYGTAPGALHSTALGSFQQASNGPGSGGFGGGGGGAYGGGGGGGYSGGACGDWSVGARSTGGAGGGSYFSGSKVEIRYTTGNGYVEIDKL